LTELPLSKTRKNFLFSFLSVEKQTNLTAPYRLDTLPVKKDDYRELETEFNWI
jgi:hypothetical protein